jgi:putative SbcD/Mre11-related phosphoesterase
LILVERELKVLVAADLHLGLEYELWLGGISIPSQTDGILKRLKAAVSEQKPDRLVLLGDVKHNVPRTSWQERQEVPAFLKSLSEEVRVLIVPGNHDAGLTDMAPVGTEVKSAEGFVLDGVGYFHGHTWPSQDVFRARLLLTAHLHPAVRLKDPLGCGSSRRVWVRNKASPESLRRQYRCKLPARDLIVVPAFNDLCGGLPLNEPREEVRGPVMAMSDMMQARITLLDGTDLGTLREIVAVQGKT